MLILLERDNFCVNSVISLTSYAVVCSNIVVHNSDHNSAIVDYKSTIWNDSHRIDIIFQFRFPNMNGSPDFYLIIDTGPEGPELEGYQANRESKAANTRRNGLSGTQARVTMEVVVAVQSGTISFLILGQQSPSSLGYFSLGTAVSATFP